MVIRFDRVGFAYPHDERPVLRDLSLSVEDGSHVALLGRNGSGKSTAARLTNGLLTATTGTVLVDGIDASDRGRHSELRRAVQLVFQNPENQQVGTTVYDDIAFGLANFGVPTREMPGRVAEALEAAGIDVPFERLLDGLSGGQQQRVAIASALALRSRHLVLDEITSMLDPQSRTIVAATIAGLRAERELTVLQITHHLDEVVDADLAAVLIDGRIERIATPADIFSDTALLEAAGLEAPAPWRTPRPRGTRSLAPDVTRIDLDAVAVDHGARRRLGRPTHGSTRPALRGVDLHLGAGITAVAGRSGAGKSTLISVLSGLRRPTAGHVLVDGKDAHVRGGTAFDGIAVMFQNPQHQLFAATVRRDVGFGLQRLDLPAAVVAERVDDALRETGLDPDEVGGRSPFALSGGQQRRVALAGILVADPRIILLDEPTAGLDLPSRRALFSIIEGRRDAGVPIVWVSHRLDEILEHADRLVVLEEGRIVADGAPDAVLDDPVVVNLVGESPSTASSGSGAG